MKKKILLIATGGTIASKYTEDGLSPQISAEELLQYIPAARDFCTIDTIQPFSLDSTNVCASHWLELAKLIEKKYEFMTALSSATALILWLTQQLHSLT